MVRIIKLKRTSEKKRKRKPRKKKSKVSEEELIRKRLRALGYV